MSVTACVLSYNSIATIPDVIHGISTQDRPPERILIVDNGSGPKTVEYLRSLPDMYEVTHLPDNVGVGAGHNTAWRAAFEDAACDFVWTLENDSIPPPDCLARLVTTAKELNDQGLVFGALLPKQIHPDEPYLPRRSDPHIDSKMTFNGALIPRETIAKVGLVREDFFVDQEDWEFARRLNQANLPIYVDPLATIVHLGKGKHRRSAPSILRTYYRVRNEIYLRRANNRGWIMAARVVIRTGAAILRTLLSEDNKRRRILARIAATRDGLREDLGRKDYRFLYEPRTDQER